MQQHKWDNGSIELPQESDVYWHSAREELSENNNDAIS